MHHRGERAAGRFTRARDARYAPERVGGRTG